MGETVWPDTISHAFVQFRNDTLFDRLNTYDHNVHDEGNAKCTCTFLHTSIFKAVVLDYIMYSEVRMDSDRQSSAKCCERGLCNACSA